MTNKQHIKQVPSRELTYHIPAGTFEDDYLFSHDKNMLVGGYTPAWAKTTHVLVLIPAGVHCYLYIYIIYIYIIFFCVCVWILFAIYQAQKIYRKKKKRRRKNRPVQNA